MLRSPRQAPAPSCHPISQNTARQPFPRLARRACPRTLTGKATHYHATHVRPRWASKLVRTARIGDHIFYRPAV
ncbi:MAG: cell wall hydrolase, partial [Pseudomonadota bacterium]